MTIPRENSLIEVFAERFSDVQESASTTVPEGRLLSMAKRGSCRSFTSQAVPPDWIDALCATALASPSKSDLQQRDIVIVTSEITRKALANLASGQAWIAKAPTLAVFCGNNRRQRLIHSYHDIPFANDHLDALVNAIGDAAIALGAFVTAAEAIGLGCCPISALRNDAAKVSELLDLPDHVFPFAGLAFGFPNETPKISKRLPLSVTCHTDRYQETDLTEKIAAYDQLRAQTQPYSAQRYPQEFGQSAHYTWSIDKARQYSVPERDDFGQYIRSIGFNLD